MNSSKSNDCKRMTKSILGFLEIDSKTLVNLPIIDLRRIAREKSRSLAYKTAIDIESVLSKERRRLKKLVYAESDKEKYNCLISDYGNDIDQLVSTRQALLDEKMRLMDEINHYKKSLSLAT